MQSAGSSKTKPERIQTPYLTNEERRIIRAYCKKYRQKRGAGLLLAAIPAMKADLGWDQPQRDDSALQQGNDEQVARREAA